MRTVIATHELLPKGLHLESLRIETGRAAATRAVLDLPWRGISVTLGGYARGFFCDEASCERRIFCERLPKVAARARRTGRLEKALLSIVLELGGRAGARLAVEQGLAVGRDALLSRTKRAAPAYSGRVRVLGVDDFRFQEGQSV